MRQLRGKSGTVTVEMALILPLLLLIMVGSLELGTLFSSYLRLQNAIREGGRLAAIGMTEGEITARVQQFGFGLNPDKGGRKRPDVLTSGAPSRWMAPLSWLEFSQSAVT